MCGMCAGPARMGIFQPVSLWNTHLCIMVNMMSEFFHTITLHLT